MGASNMQMSAQHCCSACAEAAAAAAASSTGSRFIVAHASMVAPVRTETFLGRTFRVVPAVLVQSQVLPNNLGRMLLPPEEFTPEWAASWNGVGVLVGEHPAMRGVPVSGRTPELWNERGVGWIFNAHIDEVADGVKRLVAEVWLDEARVEAVVGYQEVLDQLSAGEPVELSTGFPAQVLQRSGNFNGREFEGIMRPAGVDHLVISTEFTGACAVADGCGLGVNQKESTMAEQEEKPRGWKGILDAAHRLLTQRRDAANALATQWEENVAMHLAKAAEVLNATPISDQERQSMLRAALQELYGSRGDVCVCDVFSDTMEVVFWLITPLGSEPPGSQYYRASYEVAADGAYTFGDPVKVRRMTVYEPVSGNAPGASYNTADGEEVEALAVHTESHEGGSTMAENEKGVAEQLKAIAESVATLAGNVAALTKDVNDIKTAANSDPNPAIAGLKKTIGELASKVESISTVTQTAVQERERERQHLVESLAGNYKVPFSAEELATKPLSELRKLADMAQVESYGGRGAPRAAGNTGADEPRFVQPVPYYLKDKNKSAEA